MKARLRVIKDVASWIILAVMFVFFIYVVFTITSDAKRGEESFIFGYRPLVIFTGSMEPYMMTNSVAMTKEVTDIKELEVGDVITFHIKNDMGEQIRITHRLIEIDGDTLYTQGDNNRTPDGLPLTMDNVEAKVTWVCNGTAWLVAEWKTTSGKIMICTFVAALFLGYFALKVFLQGKREEHEITMELLDTFSDLADKLGQTPRQLLLADIDRHQEELSAKLALAEAEPEVMEGESE